MLLFFYDHYKLLTKAKRAAICIRRHRAGTLVSNKFEFLLASVATQVDDTWDYYIENLKTNKRQTFITVMFDGWDSKKKDVLGVTVSFYNPCGRDPHAVCVALGLVPTTSKKSADVAQEVLKVLGRAGIEKDDLLVPVNDTAMAALAVGFALTGVKGTCAMHRVNLVIEHATGRRTRSSQRKITGSFPECKEFRKQAHAFGSYYNNNKKKSTYRKYQEYCTKARLGCKRISLPNATRAAGVSILYQSIVIQRFAFAHYWFHKPETGQMQFTDDQFQLVAELESVLCPMSLLIKKVQSNQFCAIAYSFMRMFQLPSIRCLSSADHMECCKCKLGGPGR